MFLQEFNATNVTEIQKEKTKYLSTHYEWVDALQ